MVKPLHSGISHRFTGLTRDGDRGGFLFKSGFVGRLKIWAFRLRGRRLFEPIAAATVFAAVWIKEKVECQKQRLRMAGKGKIKDWHWKDCQGQHKPDWQM